MSVERLSDRAIEIIDELHTERLDYTSEYLPLIDAANKLAAYEATGLEPEDLKKPFDEEALLTMTARGMGTTPDRLRELVEADRAGRCVVLPCKLHDKVFFIENGYVKDTEVVSFHNWTSGHWKISTETDRMYDHWKGYEIDFSGIGKTVFLTREAAEAALKGEQDG